MTPETKLLTDVRKYLDRLREQGEPLWYMKVHGGVLQRRGVPDLLIVFHGHALFVELKTPGRQPTRLQAHVMAQIEKAGGSANVVHSVAEMQDFLREVIATLTAEPTQ